MPGWLCLSDQSDDRGAALRPGQLLSRGLRRSTVLSRGRLYRGDEPDQRRRVHRRACRLVQLGGRHKADALSARLLHRCTGQRHVRWLHGGELPGRERCDVLPGLFRGFLLRARCLGSGAVPCWELQWHGERDIGVGLRRVPGGPRLRGGRDGTARLRRGQRVGGWRRELHGLRGGRVPAVAGAVGVRGLPRGQLLPGVVERVHRVRARQRGGRRRAERVYRLQRGRVSVVVWRDSVRAVRRGRLVRRGRELGGAVRRGHLPRHDGRRVVGRLRRLPGGLIVRQGRDGAGRLLAGQRRWLRRSHSVRGMRRGQVPVVAGGDGVQSLRRGQLLRSGRKRGDALRRWDVPLDTRCHVAGRLRPRAAPDVGAGWLRGAHPVRVGCAHLPGAGARHGARRGAAWRHRIGGESGYRDAVHRRGG